MRSLRRSMVGKAPDCPAIERTTGLPSKNRDRKGLAAAASIRRRAAMHKPRQWHGVCFRPPGKP
jgi:hypothetical protein